MSVVQVFQKIKSSMGSTSQYKFGVLTRIVRHMRERHMAGEDHPLNLEEILDETSQLDVSTKTRTRLATEVFKQNPKLKVLIYITLQDQLRSGSCHERRRLHLQQCSTNKIHETQN